MLEWILEREGHEFMVAIDRSFIRDESNLVGLAEKMSEDLHMPKEILVKQNRLSLYIRHLYKASAPTASNLADEKYLAFI